MPDTNSFKRFLRRQLPAIALGIFFACVLLEICCQVYSFYLDKRWDAVRRQPSHYFTASDHPVLAYELAPEVAIESQDRRLHINRFGIRDEDGTIGDAPTIAILGDSVVFGNVLSQEHTISALLQQSLDRTGDEFKVLNFGVPGYALAELVEFLKIKDRIYDVGHVIYVLNPNDFARRDSIYEGADGGLYRMYRKPWVKSLWFLRKAIYRFVKYAGSGDYTNDKASVRWYRWLYKGNRSYGRQQISQLATYASQAALRLDVVLLPVGVAYDDDGSYALSEVYEDIGAFLFDNEINYVDPTADFVSTEVEYFDPTDHLTVEGNLVMVDVLRSVLGRDR